MCIKNSDGLLSVGFIIMEIYPHLRKADGLLSVGSVKREIRSMSAWNSWYHVTGNTYGTWVRGDRRGWREWKHHEHVEGDYKHPPPIEECEPAYEQSLRRMKYRPVHLNHNQRRIAGQGIIEKLVELDIEIITVSVDAVHYHILARFRDDQVRRRVGRAKKNASHLLSDYGLRGTVWAKRCRPLPIRSREHQLNVFNYILDHGKTGAWTWSFREGLYWLKGSTKQTDG